MPIPTRLTLLLVLVLAPACQNLDRHHKEPAPASASEPALDPVSAAMAIGDLDAARAALDELLLARELTTARAALDAGAPEDALIAVDRALRIAPRDVRVIALKAEGSAALAEHMIAAGNGPLYVEGALLDALNSYTSLPPTPANLTAASELAGRLDKKLAALRLGRAAVNNLEDSEDEDNLRLATRAYKAWGQAALRAYIATLQFAGGNATEDLGLDPEVAFNEAEDALMSTVGFAPDEVARWSELANLYLWRGDSASAIEMLARGLDRLPHERDLLEALVRAAGPERALEELESRTNETPELDFVRGRERLTRAIPRQASDPARALEAATLADAEFARVPESDAALWEAARGWRVIARAVEGWALYNQSQLDEASEAFLSMDDLIEGGLTWRLEGSVKSGIDGLYFIGDQYRQRGDWERAAQTFGALEVAQPEFANWANNAGFFARDAAVALEAEGRDLCRAAAGELSDDRRHEELRILASVPPEDAGSAAERAAFAAAANERFVRAKELARQSYASYLHASEFAPDDVRIVNDTALIQVYYLHEDLDAAQAYLERAIELGTAQLAADDANKALDEGPRRALEEALGDAFQNMGVLHLMLLDDPQGALTYLESSRAIGPNPRPLITEALIPWCRGELQAPLATIMPEVNWCAPCTENQ